MIISTYRSRDEQAKAETVSKYGAEPGDPVILGLIAFIVIAFGVPLCVMAADMLGFVFGHQSFALDNDSVTIIGYTGIVVGMVVFFIGKRRRSKWHQHYFEALTRLEARDDNSPTQS